MKKSALLQILKKNRDEHRDIFIAAQEGYREAAIRLLDRQLENARQKRPFVLAEITALTAPSDHTYYDREIRMLELSEDDIIQISAHEFECYVMDKWQWTRDWAVSNMRYTNSPKFRAAVD